MVHCMLTKTAASKALLQNNVRSTKSTARSAATIHIFSEIGNEALNHAKAVKSRFERAFPDIPIYLTYVEPHFLLRAGDFRNRVEAEKCLRQIKPKFKEAFVTADKIYRPKVSLYKNEE